MPAALPVPAALVERVRLGGEGAGQVQGLSGRLPARAVMAGQLTHLLRVAEQEHVQVRVIPSEVSWHTGLAGPFVLIRLPDGAEAAYVDNRLRGQVVTESADIASLGGRWESVAGEALPRRRSIELIREVATTWT
ncbi:MULTISPECIES: Scr1 family TA system antitoxin-like transcriptional regulator [unclassified Micromonospora]|uniref:Scr1 family TA system antitoxin-like transcriptional regulator n=1 Tax=unclassified Micromonospora TaxID=2617518 RepID=UPI00332BDEAD